MDKFKFGEFVYKRRNELQLTQEQLGYKLGVTNKAVSKWETGETLPDIQLMQKLAYVLNVSMDELYTQEIKEKETVNVTKRKTNVLIYILLIIFLLIIVVLSILLFKKDKSKIIIENKPVIITKSNLFEYYQLTPCYRSTNDNQSLVIYGEIRKQDSNFIPAKDFEIEFTYSVEYYYITVDSKKSLLSYVNNKEKVTISKDETIINFSINLTPSYEISNFKEFYEFSFNYEILNIK